MNIVICNTNKYSIFIWLLNIVREHEKKLFRSNINIHIPAHRNINVHLKNYVNIKCDTDKYNLFSQSYFMNNDVTCLTCLLMYPLNWYFSSLKNNRRIRRGKLSKTSDVLTYYTLFFTFILEMELDSQAHRKISQ